MLGRLCSVGYGYARQDMGFISGFVVLSTPGYPEHPPPQMVGIILGLLSKSLVLESTPLDSVYSGVPSVLTVENTDCAGVPGVLMTRSTVYYVEYSVPEHRFSINY